jgi:hypothetical protein
MIGPAFLVGVGQLPALDVEAVVLGVAALAAAVALVVVVDLVVELVAVVAVSLLAAVVAVLVVTAIQPPINTMPATLAVPATRRARRAGWGRRRLRAGGVVGAVSMFDSFAVPHCRGFDGVDDLPGTSESPQDALGSPADLYSR